LAWSDDREKETARAPRRSNRLQAKWRSVMMNWDFVQGNWKQVSGKVKQQWGKLTDDDLAKIAGKREELEGKLQERYGLSKDEIKKQLDDFMTRH
jgi:uncharacterized protein YjbJ (UPF0337 family)